MSRLKDIALEKSLVLLLRPKLQRYGELRQFSLDTTARAFTAEVRLRGDPVPLIISQAHYRVEQNGNQAMLVIHDLKVSKEWAQNVIDDHLPEISLKIPDFIRPLIE